MIKHNSIVYQNKPTIHFYRSNINMNTSIMHFNRPIMSMNKSIMHFYRSDMNMNTSIMHFNRPIMSMNKSTFYSNKQNNIYIPIININKCTIYFNIQNMSINNLIFYRSYPPISYKSPPCYTPKRQLGKLSNLDSPSPFKRIISYVWSNAIQFVSTLSMSFILYCIFKWLAIKCIFYSISNFDSSWMMKHFGSTIKLFVSLAHCSGEEVSLTGLSETSLSEQDNELFHSRSLIVNSTPAIDSSGNYRRMIPTVRNMMGNLRPGPQLDLDLSFMESRSAITLTDLGPGRNFNSIAPFGPYFDTPIGPIFSIEYNYSLLKIFSLRYPSYIEDFYSGNDSSSSCSGDTDEIFSEALALIRAQQIDQNLSINSDSVNVSMGARVSVTPSEDISSSSSAFVDDSSSSAPSDSNESGFIIEKGVPIHKNFYIWVSKILGVETDVSDPNLDSEEAARRDRIRVIALSDTPLREILQDINDGFIIRGPRPRPPSVGLD